ncbi:hypothetical protein F5B20DRAFT_343211 [Whalleya microplaca]|nr:hypothetical protein F5B20DRAFT_343211 [Whalleya microplaca]
MADSKSSDKEISTEEPKVNQGRASQTDSGDGKKAEESVVNENSAASRETAPKQLLSHYKGMPKDWEKNRVAKKEN